MSSQYDIAAQTTQEAAQVSWQLAGRLSDLFAPLLTALDKQLDVRLVRTFLVTIAAIIQFRNRAQGLLLSELGALLTCPEQAPAGTKRLSNLLRSTKWGSALIETYLWQQANGHLDHLEQLGSLALCIWDGSVLEKAESEHLEGLCAVRSSKAKRLRKLKPGLFNQLSGPPIVVRGMEWTAVLLASLKDLPTVVAMQWWSRKGVQATTQREVEASLLERMAGAWGERVLHVFDRGYASRAWLGLLQEAEGRFLIRWQKGHVVCDALGQERKVWQLIRGKRPQERRMVFDARSRHMRLVGINVVPFRHPGYAGPLWLVVARPGGGREPWYLVTNMAVTSLEQGWQLIFAYARRWQIELTFRFTKCELGMESPRLWKWENRIKLLLIVTLAYVFLLSLVHPLQLALRTWLLRHFCHRTGKRCREVTAPLYRLRWALSRLWQAYDPRAFLCLPQNSG
jgi:Transposase DDE domain